MTHLTRPSLRLLTCTLLAWAALGAAGCPSVTQPAPFGRACNASADCGDPTLQCRSVDGAEPRCVFPRQPTEPGESCENAILATDPDDAGPLIVDTRVLMGAAVDDADVCGFAGTPDVSIRFTLATAAGITVDVDDKNVAVGVRAVANGVCGGPTLRFGCATSAEPALLPALDAGEYELIIDGTGTQIGTPDEVPVHVVVRRVDCPLGGIPVNGRCLVYEPQAPLLVARTGAGALQASDGRVVVVGGSTRPLAFGETFTPGAAGAAFIDTSFGELDHPTVFQAGSVLGALDDDDIVAIAFHASFSVPDWSTSGFLASNYFGAAVADGSTVIFSSSGEFIAEPEALTCTRSNECDLGVCGNDGFCLCDMDECFEQDGVLHEVTEATTGEIAAGDSIIAVGDNRVVAGHAGTWLSYAVRNRRMTGERDVPRTLRLSDALATSLDQRFVYAFGGTDGTNPLLSVERFDVAGRTSTLIEAVMPRPLLHGRAALMGSFVVLFDNDAESDEPMLFDLDNETFVRAPLLPSARRDSALLTIGNDAWFIGGSSGASPLRDVLRLTLVAPDREIPSPPPTCSTFPLPIGEQVFSTTGEGTDNFRDEVCNPQTLSPDQQWTLDVPGPDRQSVRIITTPEDDFITPFNITVLDTLCDEKAQVLGCAAGELFLPSVPPGQYIVSIESQLSFDPSLEQALGREYSVRAILGPAEACIGDDNDPADDVLAGARPLTLADGTVPIAEGTVCPDDVDHVVVNFMGGAGDNIEVFPASFAEVGAAIVDPTSTRDHVLVTSVPNFEDYDTFIAHDQPPGVYVVRLTGPAILVSSQSWQVLDESDCERDPFDSPLESFDDATVLRDAPHIVSGDSSRRTLCTAFDRDAFIVDPDETLSSILTIDSLDVRAEVFDFADGVEGASLGTFAVVPSSGLDTQQFVLGPRAGALLVRVEAVSGVDVVDGYTLNYDQPPPGDACDEPLTLTGTSGSERIDSRTFRDDINAADVGDCTGFRTPGEDVFFTITLAAGDRLQAEVAPIGDFDVAVYVIEGCPAGDFADICLVGADAEGRGTNESLTFTAPVAGDYTLVLDSFFGESYGADLNWSVQ